MAIQPVDSEELHGVAVAREWENVLVIYQI